MTVLGSVPQRMSHATRLCGWCTVHRSFLRCDAATPRPSHCLLPSEISAGRWAFAFSNAVTGVMQALQNGGPCMCEAWLVQ